MLKVGVTGGIGSGKSTVCRIFAQLDVPVFNADLEGKEVLKRKDIKLHIQTVFGNDILDSSGEIDKVRLANIVFKDALKLEKLNSIIHPAVAESFKSWMDKYSDKKYVIKEAAILFESGANKQLDYIINVNAPAGLRMERVMMREGISRDKVEDRMKNQFSDEQRNELADFIIVNDEKNALLPQVLEIHKKLID